MHKGCERVGVHEGVAVGVIDLLEVGVRVEELLEVSERVAELLGVLVSDEVELDERVYEALPVSEWVAELLGVPVRVKDGLDVTDWVENELDVPEPLAVVDALRVFDEDPVLEVAEELLMTVPAFVEVAVSVLLELGMPVLLPLLLRVLERDAEPVSVLETDAVHTETDAVTVADQLPEPLAELDGVAVV